MCVGNHSDWIRARRTLRSRESSTCCTLALMQLSHPLSSSPHAQASLRHLQTGRLVLMLSGGSNAAKARPPVALTRTPFLLREKPSKATAPNFRAVLSCAAAGVLCSQRVHTRGRTGLRAERDEAKARFVDWMRETGIVASPKVDIVPDAEGGRRVVCTAPIERGESLFARPKAYLFAFFTLCGFASFSPATSVSAAKSSSLPPEGPTELRFGASPRLRGGVRCHRQRLAAGGAGGVGGAAHARGGGGAGGVVGAAHAELHPPGGSAGVPVRPV